MEEIEDYNKMIKSAFYQKGGDEVSPEMITFLAGLSFFVMLTIMIPVKGFSCLIGVSGRPNSLISITLPFDFTI